MSRFGNETFVSFLSQLGFDQEIKELELPQELTNELGTQIWQTEAFAPGSSAIDELSFYENYVMSPKKDVSLIETETHVVESPHSMSDFSSSSPEFAISPDFCDLTQSPDIKPMLPVPVTPITKSSIQQATNPQKFDGMTNAQIHPTVEGPKVNFHQADMSKVQVPKPTKFNGVGSISDPLVEILQLINWIPEEHQEKNLHKRKKGVPYEIQTDRHRNTEKQRRSDMNDLVERLKAFLPIDKEEKHTKLFVLQEAEEYLVRLQALTVRLLQENKEIKSELEILKGRHPDNEVSKKRKLSNNMRNYMLGGAKATFLAIFFTFSLWNPFSFGEMEQTDSTGRVILGVAETSRFAWESYLASFFWICLRLWAFCILSFVILIFGERPVPVDSEAFTTAKKEAHLGELAVWNGQFKEETNPRFHKALKLLNHPLPSTDLVRYIYVLFEVYRFVMHTLKIGVWTERALLKFLGFSKEYGSEVVHVSSLLLRNDRATPDVDWLYLTLHNINLASIIDDQALTDELYGSSLHRMTGNLAFPYKIMEVILNWGLKRSYRVNPCFEYKILLQIYQGIQTLLMGDIEGSKVILKTSLELCRVGTTTSQNMLRILAILGAIQLFFEKKRLLSHWKLMAQIALKSQSEVGQCWALLGILDILVETGRFEEAVFGFRYFELNFANYISSESPEALLFRVKKARLTALQGNYMQSIKQIKDVMRDIRDYHLQRAVFYSVGCYENITETLVFLWEESLTETSSIRPCCNKLARMVHESCSYLQHLSGLYHILEPVTLFWKGRYHFMLKDYLSAFHLLSRACQVAKEMKMENAEKQYNEHLKVCADLVPKKPEMPEIRMKC